MLYKFLSDLVLILDAMEEFWKPPIVDEEILMYMRFAGSSVYPKAIVYGVMGFLEVQLSVK
jgi:hypothetical protein